MATLRKKGKLAAVGRKTQVEHPRNGPRNTSVPRINEEYIKQVSEEIEGRVTKKLSQEFNRIESLQPTDTPEPFRENSGTQTWKTRNQMRIVPRMILILKWDPRSISPVIQLIQNQTRLLTTDVFLENIEKGFSGSKFS